MDDTIQDSVDELRVRSYQAEMLKRSLEGNVIVVMDTGSGKTAIAVLRIREELNCCPAEKLVWFMAPTVALCTQQHAYLRSYLPAVRTQLLTGADNVDRWSEQSTWDSVLEGVRIVVSTHAVLEDALSHGFIAMRRLALLVFDEAHSCVGGHAGNRIMRNLYYPTKARSGVVPHILGLSASPILRSNLKGLSNIEANLDATCVTPRLHRQDLLKFVHHPKVQRLEFPPCKTSEESITGHVFSKLRRLSERLSLEQRTSSAPSVPHRSSTRAGRSTSQGSFTDFSDQIRKFYNKATHVYKELGPSAAAYYILRTTERIRNKAELLEASAFYIKEEDKMVYQLQHVFNREELTQAPDVLSLRSQLSPKVERLIAFLERQEPEQCSGLIFVQQRAIVGVLYTILANHPRTMTRFKCATFVGLSNSSHGKLALCELLDKEAQKDTMLEFRTGKKNIVIATDALEEGIDVAACNLVVCFDAPSNLKSYIQRRGRARMYASQYVIMVPTDSIQTKLDSWPELENALAKMYQDDDRARTRIALLENEQESVDDSLCVGATGAYLTAEKAMSHLHHFCDVMPRQRYAETRPVFSFREKDSGLITCTVTLPNCVKSSLRSTRGRRGWRTERAAMRDAAFQCYVALFEAGLLNDHLLPLTHEWKDHDANTEQLLKKALRSKQIKPFTQMARAWATPDLHQTTITVSCNRTHEKLSMRLTTPTRLSYIPDVLLYWDSETIFQASFGNQSRKSVASIDMLEQLRAVTQLLDKSTRSDQSVSHKTDFVLLLGPDIEENQLMDWFKAYEGRVDMLDALTSSSEDIQGLVRSTKLNGKPLVFFCMTSEPQQKLDLEVVCVPLIKRRNFEAPNALTNHFAAAPAVDLGRPSAAVQIRARECTVDLLDHRFAIFNLFVPSLWRHIEASTVAHQLQETILPNVSFCSLSHIVTAISAPSAGRATNYQRFEFFGDALLKFQTSVQLFTDHGNWPEGYLSQRKDSLVSNARLARAAIAKGLGSFILTDPLRRKWSVPRISDADQEAEERTLGIKALADVVEALIGAAYIDSGFKAARACTNVFLPEISAVVPQLPERISVKSNSPRDPEAETLIGYRFQDELLLLEALTHPSCGIDAKTESYQRLEFLGDAVLDVLISTFLSRCLPELSQGQMTRIKAALGNKNILGYLCLHFSMDRDLVRIETGPDHRPHEVRYCEKVPLWQFMRHHSPEVVQAHKNAGHTFEQCGAEIQKILSEGATYPWKLLARLGLDKFYSDLVESVFGAVFNDSQGDLSECEKLFERIGLKYYAARMAEGSLDVVHPRDELQGLIGSSKLEIDVQPVFSGEDRAIFVCSVRVEGTVIAEAQGCITEDEACVGGIQAAVAFLRSQQEGRGR